MKGLIVATNAVRMDEPAWSLSELNLPTPDSRGVHRYQIIKVLRGEPPPVEFRRDLGNAKKFKGREIVFIGGGVDPETGRYWSEETVGSLYDMAERWRAGYHEQPEMPRPADLIGMYHDQPDKRRRAAKALSSFGPATRIQRG